MKIQHISDVHCEFHFDQGRKFATQLPVEGDVLVLPGDFATHRQLTPILSELCLRFPFVIHVPGNHEYYGSNRGTINNKLRKLENKFPNFRSLNNEVLVIDGVRILGTTLWWEVFKVSPVDMIEIKQILNDYSMIQGYQKWVGRENLESIDFLHNNLQKDDIVVTHHAPSWMSRNARHDYNSAMDHCYYNNLDKLIIEKQPKLWVHGHTHDYTDYMLGDTRVVSSPHGYGYAGGQLTGMVWLDRYKVVEV